MLRRVATSLFWAARYLERAQWNARLMDVNYNLLLEATPRDADPWEPLVRITGQYDFFSERHSRADEAAVIDFFIFDRGNPSSIRNCVETLRNNMSPLRYLISSELWIAVNGLYFEVRDWSPEVLATQGVFAFFAELKNRFYTIMGIMTNTLPRDSVYDLIEMGTLLERADNVTRLLDVKYHYLLPNIEDIGGAADLRQWGAVLKSASALEAFRRTHGNAITVAGTIDYLVFEPTFPRSLRFSIESLSSVLERMMATDAARPASVELCAELLARLRTTSAAEVIASGLHEFLLIAQNRCARLADMIFSEFMSLD